MLEAMNLSEILADVEARDKRISLILKDYNVELRAMVSGRVFAHAQDTEFQCYGDSHVDALAKLAGIIASASESKAD